MDRRSFLVGSIAISGVGALRGAPGAEQAGTAGRASTEDKLLLGTVTYNIAKDWDLPTIIKNCTETGFEGVELRTTHAHGVEIALPPEKRKQVKARFADSAVTLVGLGSTCEFHSPDPAVVKKNIEETKAWVQLAKDVGAGGVKVRPNGLRPDVPEDRT